MITFSEFLTSHFARKYHRMTREYQTAIVICPAVETISLRAGQSERITMPVPPSPDGDAQGTNQCEPGFELRCSQICETIPRIRASYLRSSLLRPRPGHWNELPQSVSNKAVANKARPKRAVDEKAGPRNGVAIATWCDSRE